MPVGRIFFPWFFLGILQPHLDCGRGLCPLSLPWPKQGAKGDGEVAADNVTGMTVELTNSTLLRYNSTLKYAGGFVPTSLSADR